MTEKQRQAKLAKLYDKLIDMERKLYKAQCEEHERLNRMGWGYGGMRHAKISFSTRKSDRIKERIKICKQQIKELHN